MNLQSTREDNGGSTAINRNGTWLRCPSTKTAAKARRRQVTLQLGIEGKYVSAESVGFPISFAWAGTVTVIALAVVDKAYDVNAYT
jgi:hypothetical protein